MKHLIIGTAGHIDHGKTQLIAALTGRNTDRLKEEQKRGISIDLGFTFFTLPSGLKAGIIDVPGHEKFIKNMLAGIMGIDLVLLVVAADEGIMPQTTEHLNILQLIGMKHGIVVITKIDLADEDWVDLVEEEIKEEVKNTFLENAPIVRVSSTKKIGLDVLVREIENLAEKIDNTEDNKLPRLSIDRVFTIKGLGTIVTGTLLSGTLNEGDEVEIYPKKLKSKIRSIEVHDEGQKTVYSRQRAALNLPGLKKTEIERGDVVALPDTLIPTMMLDCKVVLLKNTLNSLKNRTRVRLYIGSKEVLARIILLDREEIKSGEEVLVQFRLEEEITAQRGDKFIMRFYSPMFTIGGGEIIDSNPKKHQRYNSQDIESLENRANIDEKTNLYTIINQKSSEKLSLSDLRKLSTIEEDSLLKMIAELSEEKKIRIFSVSGDLLLISEEYYNRIKKDIIKFVDDFHKNNPYVEGVPKEELIMRIFNEKKSFLGDHILYSLAEENAIKLNNHFVSLFDFKITIGSDDSEIKSVIIKSLTDLKFNLIRKNDFLNSLFIDDKIKHKKALELFHYMVKQKDISVLDGDFLILTDMLEVAEEKLRSYIKQNSSITLADYRTLLETNRKVAMGLLDYFDSIGVTERRDDIRVLQGD